MIRRIEGVFMLMVEYGNLLKNNEEFIISLISKLFTAPIILPICGNINAVIIETNPSIIITPISGKINTLVKMQIIEISPK